ncbi:hypothetical protein Adu01nite_41820 [Paractinoplanes durhamensis]|uniref:Uncharacterized protein n=1 Tax=Paractinoplanes durhamensis TaxID=113563 RepID=A0ABQ3YZ13_9ACTN|nr:hypothetical protein Adu01nite_41820 [Actinoplanes durhamensis]
MAPIRMKKLSSAYDIFRLILSRCLYKNRRISEGGADGGWRRLSIVQVCGSLARLEGSDLR